MDKPIKKLNAKYIIHSHNAELQTENFKSYKGFISKFNSILRDKLVR